MLKTIRLTKMDLIGKINEFVRKALGKNTIQEIKYFHPSGRKELPNGNFYQKGGFIRECSMNANSFVLSEDIHGDPYGTVDDRGGVIVFATGVSAVQLHCNRLHTFIKQFLKTQSQRFNNGKKAHKTIDNEPDTNSSAGAYCFGNCFRGKYVGDNGEMFNDTSLALEINGLSSKGLMRLAGYITKEFLQDTVLVKDLNVSKIYLVHQQPIQNTKTEQTL